MEKIKFKEKWLNKLPINYNNVSINTLIEKDIAGVYTEDDKQILLIFEGGKLLFLDALTFEELKNPLKLGAAKYGRRGEHVIKMVSNRPHYFMGTYTYDLVVDLWSGEIIIKNEYPDTERIRSSSSVEKFIVEDEFLYILRYPCILEVWNILQRKLILSHTLDGDIDIFSSTFRKFDNILQVKTHAFKRSNFIHNLDISTNVVDKIPVTFYNDLSDVKIEGKEAIVKLNGKWVVIINHKGQSPQGGHNFILDALTYEMISEFVGDGDPMNRGGNLKIHYNEVGDPLLIVTFSFSYERGYVYNLNHIDKGFQYFKDYSNRLSKDYLGKRKPGGPITITPEYEHLYKDCCYLTRAVVFCDFKGETVAVEERSGKMWSLKTLEPIKDIQSPKYGKGNLELSHLYPVDLPNGQTGIITNWGELWNPLGVPRDSIGTLFMESATINNQAVFVAYSEAGFLVLYDTLTGKELCRSEKLNHDVNEMLLTQLNGKDIVVVCSKLGMVEHYTLSDLQKTGTSYQLKALLAHQATFSGMCVVPFENKLQLLVNIGYSHLCTWDFLTGEPIHQPLKVGFKREGNDTEVEILEPNWMDFDFKLIHQNNQPFLAINVLNTENAFLWDLNKGEYVGALDLYDKKLEKYFDEDTSTYNIFDFEPVQINGQDLILTISGSGVFSFFDPTTLLRVGLVKSTEIEYERFQVISHKGQQLIVAKSFLTFYIFDLLTLKIVKKITFDQKITAYTISNGHIIIASGEEVVAYEIK